MLSLLYSACLPSLTKSAAAASTRAPAVIRTNVATVTVCLAELELMLLLLPKLLLSEDDMEMEWEETEMVTIKFRKLYPYFLLFWWWLKRKENLYVCFISWFYILCFCLFVLRVNNQFINTLIKLVWWFLYEDVGWSIENIMLFDIILHKWLWICCKGLLLSLAKPENIRNIN